MRCTAGVAGGAPPKKCALHFGGWEKAEEVGSSATYLAFVLDEVASVWNSSVWLRLFGDGCAVKVSTARRLMRQWDSALGRRRLSAEVDPLAYEIT